jgi:hypothetical protein
MAWSPVGVVKENFYVDWLEIFGKNSEFIGQ